MCCWIDWGIYAVVCNCVSGSLVLCRKSVWLWSTGVGDSQAMVRDFQVKK